MCYSITWFTCLNNPFFSVELMFIISMPLYADTARVVSSRHVTSNGLSSEQVITLYNVPSSLRITSLLLDLSTNIILPFGQTMHPLISMLSFPFGILNVVCKVSLISLIDFTNGCCITDIICACLSFVVLITNDGGLVSIDTDPNVVIVDNIFFIFELMLYLKLSCCRHPSSDKAIRFSSFFFTSSSKALLPWKVCRSDAYSLRALMSLCNPSTVFEFCESCFNRFFYF